VKDYLNFFVVFMRGRPAAKLTQFLRGAKYKEVIEYILKINILNLNQ